MKILLMTPIWALEKMWGKFKKGAGCYPPNGLALLAAVLEKDNFDVSIYDASYFSHSEGELEEYLRKNEFSLVGITCYTTSIKSGFKTAQVCKRTLPNVKIVIGGVHATLMPEETLEHCKEVDFVCVGEGELTLLELARHLRDNNPKIGDVDGISYRNEEGQIVNNNPRAFIRDLDSLPMPAYHLINLNQYVLPQVNYLKLPTYSVYISRGCPYSCAFCNTDVFGKIGRFRSVESVISEIKFLKKEYGCKGIYFYDGTLTYNMNWFKSFCEAVIAEDLDIAWSGLTRIDRVDADLLKLMKKAGCWRLSFGIESANQESLDLLRKGIKVEDCEKTLKLVHKSKIQTTASYILAIPGEDEKMSRNTIKFAKKMCTNSSIFFLPIPMPKTRMREICREMGGLNEDADDWDDYSTFNLENPLYINPKIGKENMVKLYNSAYAQYYTSPRVILKNLRDMRSFTDIKRNFSGFMAISDFINPKNLYRLIIS